MTLVPILTSEAPRPLGPYSQAIRAEGLVFVSGQLPLDRDGKIVEGGIEEQTKAVLGNLASVLEAAGSGLSKVVKTTIFLANLDDFAAMNEVYAGIFTPPYPARSTVEVVRFPGRILIEIECIALA
ncbi:Rid family detoxifying hydrolase [Microvirga thermotolerans]|uniref:Deaminase n=1 Tax=Microvirga thermotolerans TaxID=2651334 RepID=A0A5P9K241_9HYPH|nr:Rid family detoxifying hydrolase [Microvirga thermotolerans]QFU17695.1 deaminase [Microvirga thermotolerans]